MPFSVRGQLIEAVIEWMDRTDIIGNADDFLTLAEAGLNRDLVALEADTTLTGTISSRFIDISALGINVPMELWLRDGAGETQLLKLSDGEFPYSYTDGKPTVWTVEDEEIQFDCPLGAAYSFRLHHTIRFALSDDADTNWLLTNHPDVYLSAVITWGAIFAIDGEMASLYAGPLTSFIASVNRQEARKKKGKLTVDPALITRRRGYMVSGF